MRRITFKIFFLFLLLGITSCNKKKEPTADDLKFGTIHPNQTVKKTLILEFNDEAKNDNNAFVEFAFVSETGMVPEGITFIVDGKEYKSNTRFYAHKYKDSTIVEIPIEVRFPRGVGQKNYKGNFQLAAASGGLKDNIDYGQEKNKMTIGDAISWNAKYEVPFPIWQKSVIGILILIVVFHLIWFLFLKNRIYPKFQGGDIYVKKITERDGITAPLRGKIGIHLGKTNPPKHSIISKLYKGETVIILDDNNANFSIFLKPVIKKNKTHTKLFNASNSDLKLSYGKVKDMQMGNDILYNDDKISIDNSFEFTYMNDKHFREEF